MNNRTHASHRRDSDRHFAILAPLFAGIVMTGGCLDDADDGRGGPAWDGAGADDEDAPDAAPEELPESPIYGGAPVGAPP